MQSTDNERTNRVAIVKFIESNVSCQKCCDLYAAQIKCLQHRSFRVVFRRLLNSPELMNFNVPTHKFACTFYNIIKLNSVSNSLILAASSPYNHKKYSSQIWPDIEWERIKILVYSHSVKIESEAEVTSNCHRAIWVEKPSNDINIKRKCNFEKGNFSFELFVASKNIHKAHNSNNEC